MYVSVILTLAIHTTLEAKPNKIDKIITHSSDILFASNDVINKLKEFTS